MPDLRLVFMGTPEFAVPSLKILLAHGYTVAAVVTAPDKPTGRGQKITCSPIKTLACKHNLPVLQPTCLKDHVFVKQLQSFQANLQVVVAFKMLPQVIWHMPSLGTVNLHASLLPQYRGAAPIHWAVINGERETGVTTFFLAQTMDTGPIILQEKERIHDCDTTGMLYTRLMHKGAQLVLKTVKAIENKTYTRTPHPTISESLIKKAPKIYKSTGQINWQQPAQAIRNFIRGLAPYPGAWTVLQGKNFKIYGVETVPACTQQLKPGEIISDGKHYVYIGTQDAPLAITSLQLAGKKLMIIEDFLKGNRLGGTFSL